LTQEGAVFEKSTRNEVDYAASFGLQNRSRAIEFKRFRVSKRKFRIRQLRQH
jgi:hypothetical protein